MKTKTNWIAAIEDLGPELAKRASEADSGRFVSENYDLLRSAGAMAAAVPGELGGGGASHSELSHMLRIMAHHCPSTALAFSMHSHLVAATVWKHLHGKGGEPLLRKVAEDQIVLLSTGGTDWVDSNGTMEKVDGGYLVSGRKVFGSGAPAADLMITSSRYQHPEDGSQVLHFPIPMKQRGVTILEDWDGMGMRGTGSHTILLKDVFVPETAIALTRPSGRWHFVWSMVVTVAFPIFLAPYVGVAEKAREMAVHASLDRASGSDTFLPRLIGEMDAHLMAARLAWEDMVRSANDYAFDPSLPLANRTMIQKGLLADACIETTRKALEIVGGRGFYRSFGMEQLLRDVQAIGYHPLSDGRRELFTGRVALGMDPASGEVS